MEFVLIAEIGPTFAANGGDGLGIESAGTLENTGGQIAAGGGGTGATLFEAGFVEEGEGVGVEEFVGELGWDRGVDGEAADGSLLDTAQDLDEAFEVHGLLQDILHDLVDERVIGYLNVADDSLEAGCGLGEDGGHEIVGAGALDLRGDTLAFGEAEKLEAATGGPSPASFKDGRGDGGLLEEIFCGVLGKELKDVGEWKGVLLGERDVDAVVGGCGLQLEVEPAAEAFAKCEAPGLVDASAEGSVEDELHAAAVVEEAFGDDGVFGGYGAEDGTTCDDVGDELAGAGGTDAAGFREPVDGCGDLGLGWRDKSGRDIGSESRDLFAEFAYAVGEDGGALGGFAFPEGDVGRCSMGVFDEDAPSGFDPLDAPTGVAKEDDVTGGGVDGEVLSECGNLDSFRLQDDAEESRVWDGSSVGDGNHACSAAGMELVVDGVVQEVGAVAAAGGFNAVGEEVDEFVEALAGEISVGIGAAEDAVESCGLPRLGSAGGDDLLHEDVGGLWRDFEAVEFAGTHFADEGGLLKEVVAGGGEEAAFGDGTAPVAGAPDALHGDGNCAGAADLADEVDVADIDAQFEGGGGDEDFDVTVFEALLGVEAEGAGERAVMSGDVLGAETVAELEGDLFDEAAGVDKDKSGTVVLCVVGELVEDFGPHGVGGDGAEFVAGDLDGEVKLAALAYLNNGGGRTGGVGSGEEFGDELNGVLGGGKADALRRSGEAGEEGSGTEAVFPGDEGVEAFE